MLREPIQRDADRAQDDPDVDQDAGHHKGQRAEEEPNHYPKLYRMGNLLYTVPVRALYFGLAVAVALAIAAAVILAWL